MKATSSGVAFSAAKIRSPSFSRSSLSTTMTALPAAMSAIARSTPAKDSDMTVSDHLLHVLGDHIDFEVHRVADVLGPQHSQLRGRRDHPDAERLVVDGHDGQRDPVN